jgi:2-dehydropantoate 2-reductase
MEKGLKISGIWGEHIVKNINAVTSIDDVDVDMDKKPDVMLLTTKSFDTERAIKEVQSLIDFDDSSIVISLQNGIGNEEIISRLIGEGEKHTLGGMVIIGFDMLKPGHVKITVFGGNVKIGEVGEKKITPRVQKIVAVFNKAGIPTDAVDNIKAHIWSKAIYNAALNPLCAILDVNYGKLTNHNSWVLIESLVAEIFKVANAEGIELFWKDAREYLSYLRDRLIPPTAEHKPSMLNDLKKGKPTEIDFLNGFFVERGKKYSVPMPVNETIVRLVKFLE